MVIASSDLVGGLRTIDELALEHGLAADLTYDEHPTRFSSWNAGALALGAAGTHFGFVLEGRADLVTSIGRFPLAQGMYFSVSGEGVVRGAGVGMVFSSLGTHGLFSIGGPIEERGRLRYIDGSTDSLLVSPVTKGDPCLNALYFPAGTRQTPHLHRTFRVVVVARGSGSLCVDDRELPLATGRSAVVRAGTRYAFRTYAEPMVAIVYHPDSEHGPTHDEHPVITGTIVDGKPASRIEAIRTPGIPV
jgi:mannose-6-phosphate isomerase-like protein (cupin superfamily)